MRKGRTAQTASAEEGYDVAEEVHARPDRGRARRQARPGDRPRRGDPARHPGAVAPDQEQPGADRRARRRQDRDRRGPGAAHRQRRRAGIAARPAAAVARPRRAWSPAPNIAASSRSGSRRCCRRSSTARATSSCSSTSCTRWSAPARPRGPMDASNMLKPALARGELHCVGATTLDEYRKHIEKDAALARRFQPVFVGEPDGRGHDLDPARAEGEVRGAPQGAHHRRGDRRRGHALQPLHHRPLPARQGDRPDRRGGGQQADGDRQQARGDRRARPPHHAAADRGRGAEEGDRPGLARTGWSGCARSCPSSSSARPS